MELREVWQDGDDPHRFECGESGAVLLYRDLSRKAYRRANALRMRQERALARGDELPDDQAFWADVVARDCLLGWEGVDRKGGEEPAPFHIDGYLAGFDYGYQLAFAATVFDQASTYYRDLIASATERLRRIESPEEVREGNDDSVPTANGDGTETSPTSSDAS